MDASDLEAALQDMGAPRFSLTDLTSTCYPSPWSLSLSTRCCHLHTQWLITCECRLYVTCTVAKLTQRSAWLTDEWSVFLVDRNKPKNMTVVRAFGKLVECTDVHCYCLTVFYPPIGGLGFILTSLENFFPSCYSWCATTTNMSKSEFWVERMPSLSIVGEFCAPASNNWKRDVLWLVTYMYTLYMWAIYV